MPLEDVDANAVRARLFELVDDEGRVRARMAPRDDADSVGLEFYEPDGTVRLALGINLEGTKLGQKWRTVWLQQGMAERLSAVKRRKPWNWPQTPTHGILPVPHIALRRGKYGKAG